MSQQVFWRCRMDAVAAVVTCISAVTPAAGADALFDKSSTSEMDIYPLAQKRDVLAMPLYAVIAPKNSGRSKFGRALGCI